MDKAIIALVSVVVGWLLAQGTAFAKDWWQSRKLKNGLNEELEDIREQMNRVSLLYTRQLQIYALKGIDPSSTIPISNYFFKQYYKDAFSRLSRSQRLSYQLIHASLDSFNKQNESFLKFAEDAYRKFKGKKDETEFLRVLELWGDQVIVLYKYVMEIIWHIDYHLQHREDPKFDLGGTMHKAYSKFSQELDQEIKNILEKAKELKLEDFES